MPSNSQASIPGHFVKLPILFTCSKNNFYFSYSCPCIKMGRCSCDGLERGIKLALTYVFSHVGLCTCIAGYSVAGAFMFQWLEQKHIRPHYDSLSNRNRCIQALDNLTAGNNGTFLNSILLCERNNR